MNNNEKGMDFGKPKLTRQDVMRMNSRTRANGVLTGANA